MSAAKNILQTIYELLNGNISVNVYKNDVAQDETENYVVLYMEGGADDSTKSHRVERPVLIVDVVTFFVNSIDPDIAEDIDTEIENILRPTTTTYISSDVHITNFKRQNYEYITEPDGTTYRKVSRWISRTSY